MSLTNQNVMDKAATKLGVIEQGASLGTTDTADVLSVLNQMMTLWRETDKDLNWFEQTDATETCPIPDWSELAVITQLAIHASTTLKAPVDQILYDEASKAMNGMMTVLINQKLDNTDMSHLPYGSGRFGLWDIDTDLY